ncbi:MAG TPA: NAD(P)/FAD-dependent oxidoreductase [Streptosporangiaceae bacterium]|nr:NAD(P)/FAD-dependent oxidoreductase [Streptosporangiaceae bacterium]
MRQSRFDAVVVGGGHNGLVAAAYLARAGRSVLVLERLPDVGGAAVSAATFAGVDARLSRYSYLVSLLPASIISDLGLRFATRPRRIASYTPCGDRGLIVDNADPARSAASFAAVTGRDADWQAWQRFYAATGDLARRLFPTMTQPLRSKSELRAIAGPGPAWNMLVERPAGETLERDFRDDTVRGVAATDALVGTFARTAEPSLRQNCCLLYHVIGNGTGAWQVPVGGMGALTAALRGAAREAGAEIRTRSEVVGIDPAGEVIVRADGTEYSVGAAHILAGVAPVTLAALLGEGHGGAGKIAEPEGSQLKINMVLSRLPRLRDAAVDPEAAFTGTFHVNEGYANLDAAYAQAAAGHVPALPPCEVYCHTLTDSSILGGMLAASGVHTLTVFGLHMPARLFRDRPDEARRVAFDATLRSINAVLAEPIEDCLLRDCGGEPCIEAKTPVDLEAELGLPGGHIFHGDLAWPFAEIPGEVGQWGVATPHPRVLLCGAGARRGGGVSGIGGHNAAMAILGAG